MRTYLVLPSVALLAFFPTPAHGAPPVVSNITAAQRTGSKLVDINYDVTADVSTVKITLAISSDGGATYSVPATTVSGDVGPGVTLGTGKTITWNAGTDWNEQFDSQVRFQLTADDLVVAPTPGGFSMIPAGQFTMGRTSGDMDPDAPPVSVTVSAFYMQVMLVTKAQWDDVRSWGTTHGYTDLDAGYGKASNHPLINVTWRDVIKWCNARSEKEGLTPCYMVGSAVMKTGTANPTVNWTATGYRLPTEAEWEKAARGGVSGKRFPWGTDTITHDDANYNSVANSYSYDLSSTRGYHPAYNDGVWPYTYTSPVGSFAANGYGLFDMAGNAFEWCWDWYGSSYYSNGATDPRGPASGTNRVGRGGYWFFNSWYCRAAARNDGLNPDTAYAGFGFRVARSLVLTPTVAASASNLTLDTRSVTMSLASPAPSHGSIQGTGSYAKNATATLTAVPDAGYILSGWMGAATGTANPLSLVMAGDKTIGASFAPDTRDSDGDGLDNYTEVVVYGTDPNNADSDGDGFLDGAEVEFGANPLSAAAVPGFRAHSVLDQTAGTIEIRFPAQQGMTYTMEASTDLIGWTPIETGIAGTGGTISRTYLLLAAPKRWFRAKTE